MPWDACPGAFVPEDAPGAVAVRVPEADCMANGNGYTLKADPGVKVRSPWQTSMEDLPPSPLSPSLLPGLGPPPSVLLRRSTRALTR